VLTSSDSERMTAHRITTACDMRQRNQMPTISRGYQY